MEKNGWLIVNSFVKWDKFQRLYSILKDSFSQKDISLEIKKASDIGFELGKSIINKPNFVLFWDKDVYLASRLEQEGIKVFNSSKSIELCDNKILTYQALKNAGIRIPKTFVSPITFEGVGYNNLDFIEALEKELSYPYIIKETYGSFGEQVYLISSKEEAFKKQKELGYKHFLAQEYISSSKGKDIRINIVGDKHIVSIYRENKTDFRSNISSGGTGKPFEPKEEFVLLALKAAKALKLDFCGVDVMFDENDKPIICEVNSNPQFESTLKVTGVNLADYIRDYVISKI